MAATEAHVMPDGKRGGWQVVRGGSGKVGTRHATQSEAERHARELVIRAGGGEVIVHGRDGRIRESATIAANGHVRAPAAE